DVAGNILDRDPQSIGERGSDDNWTGYQGGWDKNHKIYVGETPPPRVLSTSPGKGAQGVLIDINQISITFSKAMDQPVTQGAVTASFNCSKSWSGNRTLNLQPTGFLDYCEEYTVSVSAQAQDTSGIHLEESYSFSFTTEKPEIEVDAYPECVKHIEEGGSATHHVISKGNKLKSNVSCRIEFDVDNPGGWGVSGADNEDFSLLPGGTHTNTYTSTNMGATAPLDVFYQVGARCAMVGGEGYYWSAQGHMFDHPDENQSPGEMNYPTPWITRTRTDSLNPGLPDIGIMLSGWADGYGHILGRYDISTLPVKPNLKIINQPDMDISDSVKLLVIGSAGLKGFDSQLMAQELESYVINGGKLLVFTQKWGSDLSVLPGGIDGYGWSEDQACFADAAYLNQRHPVFSGQTEQVMSCNVDGYITQYPDNAEVLLRRTANGMPALLSYSCGAGRVIVS
ncbi:Ig-like domain-containing protein, partial [candidate division WOR-3 bacterium]|nr:Ig-like domain-containing protein [candidate division WOR-3 bacterium]